MLTACISATIPRVSRSGFWILTGVTLAGLLRGSLCSVYLT